MRALIVDDEMVSREKLRTIMARFGETDCVQTGTAAIERFVQAWEAWRPFDMVMLDIDLPDMRGTQVLREFRRLEQAKKVAARHRVKVAMVTATAQREFVTECVIAGCDDYVVKPFDAATIGGKIQTMQWR